MAGDSTDSTAAVSAWLQSAKPLRIANLYLMGEAEDPNALWLTDYESPLLWSPLGTFYPAAIRRGQVSSQIGFEVPSIELEYSPPPISYAQSLATAGPHQKAQLGLYDNWKVRIWSCYMPTPGDAHTFGASELFGGWIAESTVTRGMIKWKVNSFFGVVNQMVPTNVIELLNTLAAYRGASPPSGFGDIPQFDTGPVPSTTQINGDCTNIGPHQIFSDNSLQHGYVVFKDGPGATLAGVWSAIQQNALVNIGGTDYNQILLYAPLPWPPTPGVDTFYVSAAAPINLADGSYQGFPYVPDPQSAA